MMTPAVGRHTPEGRLMHARAVAASRWCVPIVLALALIGSSVAAWASAGFSGDTACCCPKPTACKCHDHDREPHPSEMKRCGGDAQLVTPVVQPAVVPDVVTPTRELRIDRVGLDRPMLPPEDRTIEIEVPPF